MFRAKSGRPVPDNSKSCAYREAPVAHTASAPNQNIPWWRVGLLALLLVALASALPSALAGCDDNPAPMTLGPIPSLTSSTTGATATSTTAGSKGASKVSVPDLVYLYLDEAEDVLSPLGLTAAVVHEEWQTAGSSDDYVIYEQDPAPGTMLAPGSSVEVSIWRFGALMPNVVGKTEAEATDELELYLLTVNVVKVVTDNPSSVGKVLAQDPAVGTPLNAGDGISTATITVGKLGIITSPIPPLLPIVPKT